jgi:heme/copper-type cytochrome/quinol oxidase subunit 2
MDIATGAALTFAAACMAQALYADVVDGAPSTLLAVAFAASTAIVAVLAVYAFWVTRAHANDKRRAERHAALFASILALAAAIQVFVIVMALCTWMPWAHAWTIAASLGVLELGWYGAQAL